MQRYPIVVVISFLLSGICPAEGTNIIARAGLGIDNRIVVTQNACQVFATAQNRKVDRMRLCKAAQRSLIDTATTNAALTVATIAGLRVESVNYIESNKVEAVFSVGR